MGEGLGGLGLSSSAGSKCDKADWLAAASTASGRCHPQPCVRQALRGAAAGCDALAVQAATHTQHHPAAHPRTGTLWHRPSGVATRNSLALMHMRLCLSRARTGRGLPLQTSIDLANGPLRQLTHLSSHLLCRLLPGGFGVLPSVEAADPLAFHTDFAQELLGVFHALSNSVRDVLVLRCLVIA